MHTLTMYVLSIPHVSKKKKKKKKKTPEMTLEVESSKQQHKP